MRTRLQAFTLTEMLIVMIVIGLLAGIALPVITKIRASMYRAGTAFEILQLDTACRTFKMDIGYFPADNYGGNWNSKTGGWNPYSGVWIPYCNIPTFLNVIPAAPSNLLNSAIVTTTPYGVPTATQVLGYTSRCLVFFLGSKFVVFQKTYGPYYSFNPKQLIRVDNIAGASGPYEYTPASSKGTWVSVSTTYQLTPWTITGIDIVNGQTVPSTHVYIYQYLDKYGVVKAGQAGNKNYYIYDVYNGIPPGAAAGGCILNYIMHNEGEFDIFSYGLDGISAWDDMPGSNTENQAAIDAKKADSSTRIQFWLGNIGDDINNWSETFKSTRVKL